MIRRLYCGPPSLFNYINGLITRNIVKWIFIREIELLPRQRIWEKSLEREFDKNFIRRSVARTFEMNVLAEDGREILQSKSNSDTFPANFLHCLQTLKCIDNCVKGNERIVSLVEVFRRFNNSRSLETSFPTM